MNIDCIQEIEKLYDASLINEWSKNYLTKVCAEGMTDALWDEAVKDMKLASAIGVLNDEDFRAFFYIDYFIEDLVEEIFGTRLTEKEEDALKSYMFSIRDDVGYTDLISFRVAILKWLQSKNKKTKEAGWGQGTRNNGDAPYFMKRHNMEHWKTLVELVRKATVYGIPKDVALQQAASELEGIEKFDFLSWYKFSFGRDKALYDINKEIREKSRGSLAVTKNANKFAGIFEDAETYYIPKFRDAQDSPKKEDAPQRALPAHDEQKAEDFNAARSKMISRTFAIDKLLEKYEDTLSEKQLEEIEDALNDLRKKVRKLKMSSMVTDVFYKTANILTKNNFADGAGVLKSIVDNKPLLKNAITEAKSEDLEVLLEDLYKISDTLKRRDLVRQLAEVDLELYSLNIAGFFPELTDAQAKLIEAYAYASNKVQDVIPKLRSGITQGGGINFNLEEEGDDLPPVAIPKKMPAPVEKREKKRVPTDEFAKELAELSKAIDSPLKE